MFNQFILQLLGILHPVCIVGQSPCNTPRPCSAARAALAFPSGCSGSRQRPKGQPHLYNYRKHISKIQPGGATGSKRTFANTVSKELSELCCIFWDHCLIFRTSGFDLERWLLLRAQVHTNWGIGFYSLDSVFECLWQTGSYWDAVPFALRRIVKQGLLWYYKTTHVNDIYFKRSYVFWSQGSKAPCSTSYSIYCKVSFCWCCK